MSEKKTGLVLCGGGGKGAFQIGAWRALAEHGILEHVDAIAGTSVGGLNAVLFAIGDYKAARKIWSEVNYMNMLPPNVKNFENILNAFRVYTVKDTRRELIEAAEEIRVGGLCSRGGLVNIIQKYVQLEKLTDKAGVDVFVTVMPDGQEKEPAYLNLKEARSENEIINRLLATSAMPYIYPMQEVNGRFVLDGGFAKLGNVPVQPLYEQGCRNIVIVALNNEFDPASCKFSEGKRVNLYEMYPGCEFTVIRPSDSLGGFLNGIIDFRPSSIRRKMLRGYVDADYILSRKMPPDAHPERFPQPDGNSVGIFIDGETPISAAYCLKHFMMTHGINACMIKSEKEIPEFPGKVIVVGHHDYAKTEIEKLDLEYHEYGMKYGFNDRLCVVQARRRELRSRNGGPGHKAFGEFYNKAVAEYPEMTEKYEIPLTYDRSEMHTREYQYDLVMLKFLKNGLPKFLGIAD